MAKKTVPPPQKNLETALKPVCLSNLKGIFGKILLSNYVDSNGRKHNDMIKRNILHIIKQEFYYFCFSFE